MLRVAQIIGNVERGGVESVVLNYYGHMDHEQIQFDLFVTENSLCDVPDYVASSGARIYNIPYPSKPIKYVNRLVKIFKLNKYKIVHVHMNTLSGFALLAAKLARVPVRICHNHSVSHPSEGIQAIIKNILRHASPLFATDYFACGVHAAQWMYGEKRLTNGNVYLMLNAIDTERFKFDAQRRREVREMLNIPVDAFVIGHIGRFVLAKNHDFLIKVFKALHVKKQDSLLLMVGDGELMESIKVVCEQSDLSSSVRFAGSVTNPEDYYSGMDVFCMPSLFEGFGLVVIEAQCSGLPCVISNAIPEEAVYTEMTHICHSFNVDEWSCMLYNLSEQSRAEQSRAEQSRAEQSRAEQSRAEQSRAEQSRAEQSSTIYKVPRLCFRTNT
jgi:glycosyltransferase EpsF